MAELPPRAERNRLYDEQDNTTRVWESILHSFRVDYYWITMTVGLYEDGAPGEIFLHVDDGPLDRDMIQGFLHAVATSVSLGLQHGIPLEVFANRLKHQKFRPAGATDNHEKGFEKAGSIFDYIFRWLEAKFLDEAEVVTQMPARA